MGFLSFGKKKKDVAPPKVANLPLVATPTKSHLRGSSNHVNPASASSSFSAASSGSSSGSPNAQPTGSNTFSKTQGRTRQSLSLHPEAILTPPVPHIGGGGSHSRAGSSTSLSVPNAPYANRDLRKAASTNTLNSTKSNNGGKRGAHDAPRIAPDLAALGTAKARSYTYHASQAGHPIIVTGHSTVQANSTAKYHSTGSQGLMNRGSSYLTVAQSSLPPQNALSDAEFKAYAKKYDMAIAKAHALAREYHHLPPTKRDRPRFEHIGRAFATAARISREQWSYRCKLEKERLEALLESTHGRPSEADVLEDEFSIHRVAGARATEGWQYSSMLASAWGVNEEVAEPLEDMPVLKPTYPISYSSSSSLPPYYGDGSPAYVHPGYTQGGYTPYLYQHPATATASSGEVANPRPPPPARGRIDSIASTAPSLESHAHLGSTIGLSHSLHQSKSHPALPTPTPTPSAAITAPLNTPTPSAATTAPLNSPTQSNHVPSGLKSGLVEETVVRPPIIKLTKGKRYQKRGSSLGA